MNKPLTDEEIEKKYGCKRTDLYFHQAKALSRNRPDTTLNDMPLYTCPHCGEECEQESYANVRDGDEWTCGSCERVMFVVDVEHTVCVKLSTHKD